MKGRGTNCFSRRLAMNSNNAATTWSVASGSEACSSTTAAPGIGHRSFAVDEECTHHQREPDHYRNEERAKWHHRMIANMDGRISRLVRTQMRGFFMTER